MPSVRALFVACIAVTCATSAARSAAGCAPTHEHTVSRVEQAPARTRPSLGIGACKDEEPAPVTTPELELPGAQCEAPTLDDGIYVVELDLQ